MKADKTFILTTRSLARVTTTGLLLWQTVMFIGCGGSQENRQEAMEEYFVVTGTWELNELRFFSGQRVDVRTGYEYIWYRFFEDNGTYYVAELSNSNKQNSVRPHEMSEYFFMMSPYDTVYIEHGRMTDLTIIDNHTIGIDRGNYVEVYVKSNKIPTKRVTEIERIIENSLRPNHSNKTQYIVPLTQTTDNRSFWIWIIVLVTIVCAGFLFVINKVRNRHKGPVTKQGVDVITEEEQREQTFIHSDFYLTLRQRLYEGPMLKHDEWEELEIQMKNAYPAFFRKLTEMCPLSEVEQRVCMLTKLGIPPSTIAIHTCREYSSISSIRSRLYFKMFGKKGGAKDWDEFIINL